MRASRRAGDAFRDEGLEKFTNEKRANDTRQPRENIEILETTKDFLL